MSNERDQKDIEEKQAEIEKSQKELRDHQMDEGLEPKVKGTIPNKKSDYESVEEEEAARNGAVSESLRFFRSKLPLFLRRLSEIKDPRNPKKVKHKLTVLILYGVFVFIYQMGSRREATREFTKPIFMKNLKHFIPELETIPHGDTLMRLLSKIEVEKIEEIHIELVRSFIRNKKFKKYLIDKCYPIAIDGTQKFARNWLWSKECLERKINETDKQYYVYTLEACLVFHNGMTIPLMTEFLDYNEGDTAEKKQDCELKAFYRLSDRLKKEFSHLKVMILLDGLYANGPVIKICRKNNWQFMIVLKDKCLPQVWKEFDSLCKFDDKKNNKDNELNNKWGERKQHFRWQNKIKYFYGKNEKEIETIHVVVCNETWEEVDKKTGERITKQVRHAWISNKPLDKKDVVSRCNLGARQRWGIENCFLTEKHHGYNYEHCFTYDWNAMKGYHYLMQLGVLFNVLTMRIKRLAKTVSTYGLKGFIRFVRETMNASKVDVDEKIIKSPYNLFLV